MSIGGQRFEVCGRIAMDQFVVDLHTEDASVAPVGTTVELFGPESGITADEWAAAAGTVRGVSVGSAWAPDAEGCWSAGGLGLPAGESGGIGGVGGPGCGPGGAAWDGVLACGR